MLKFVPSKAPKVQSAPTGPMVNNVPLQRRRALALSILMIALAQTSYIGALQGWTFVERLHDDDANYSNNCASASLV